MENSSGNWKKTFSSATPIANKVSYKYNTKQNYPTDQVISALQKAVRRSNEEEAAYWAKELLDSDLSWRLWSRKM